MRRMQKPTEITTTKLMGGLVLCIYTTCLRKEKNYFFSDERKNKKIEEIG